MCNLRKLIFGLVIDLFRSRAALEAEVLVLKQQIIVLRRGRPNRMSFLAVDRFIVLKPYCIFASSIVSHEQAVSTQ
jgi:hypothetical protein